MHTPIMDKAIVRERQRLASLDLFFESVNPGKYYVRGRRIAPKIDLEYFDE